MYKANKQSKDNNTQLCTIATQVMVVVYSTTLGDAVNAVTISTDNHGKPFSLVNAQLRIFIPTIAALAVGTTAPLQIRINDITTGYKDPNSGGDNNAIGYVAWVRKLYGITNMSLSVIGEACATVVYNNATSDGTTRSSSTGALGVLGLASISKLYLSFFGGYTLPAGTIIELRGCTK